MYFNDRRKNLVKMKLISYRLLPKEDIKDINYELAKAGVFSRGKDKKEDVWRVKKPELKFTTAPEDKYCMNEIIKKYILNTRKSNDGLDSKYFQNFTDLLTKRSDQKTYAKKRLELFYNRVAHFKKKNFSKSFSNNLYLDPYLNNKIKQNRNSTFITYIEGLNKTKSGNFRKKNLKYMDNYFNKKENLNDLYNIYKPYKSFYNTDQSNNKNLYDFNNFTPIVDKPQKFIMNNKKSDFSDDASSFFASQYNENNNTSIDNDIIAKEELLQTGDKTKYLQFLNNKYKFFYNSKLYQSKYSNDKKKRIWLYKKKPNSKYLEKEIKDSFKNELFNRIKRENMNKYLTSNKAKVGNGKKKRIIGITLKEMNKANFDKECKNILTNIQKNLQH